MSDPDLVVYRFGRFRLSPARRALCLGDEEIKLAPRTFEVLLYLVKNPGRVVSKEEVLQAVWPDSFVEEANLAQHVFRARKALEAEPGEFILTLPGRGYQFTAEVVREPGPATALQAGVAGELSVEGWRERTTIVVEEWETQGRLPAPKAAHLRVSRVWMAVGAVAVLAVVAVGAWRWHRRGAVREFRQVVLAEFENSTGDATFDHTLKRALEVELAQSPFVDVLGEREEVETLSRMARPTDTRITAEVATEICERTNREVLLSGAISSVGSRYLLTLTGSDCASGKRLVAAKAEANRREDVLDAVDMVARQVREQLKESPQSLEDHQVPLQTETTSSLEALKAYSIGKYLQSQRKDLSQRLASYQRAVELDPQFAMAYRELAMENLNISQFDLASQYFQKAFELSGHLSPVEQHSIRAGYFAYGQHNLVEGIKEYQILASMYPRDAGPSINVMDLATRLGLYDLSISTGEEAVKRFPNTYLLYANLGEAYKDANRFDDAERATRVAAQLNSGDTGLHLGLFQLAMARQDAAALSREEEWFNTQTAGAADTTIWYVPSFRASAAAAQGKFGEAERLFEASYKAARLANLPETAGHILLDEAMVEERLGYVERARATLRRVNAADVAAADLAAAWAEVGETAWAERFLAAQKGSSADTLLTFEVMPRMRALVAVGRGKPMEAVEALEICRPYEMRNYDVPELRGRALLAAGKAEEALAEFRKVMDNPGVDSTSVLYPLAHLGAARAYAMQGKKVEARLEYEAFFARFRDADAEIPVMKEAKREAAALGAA